MSLSLSVRVAPLVALGLLCAHTGYAQQTEPPTPTAPPVAVPLAEDSVRVMSDLVQRSVRQLRAIYFEPTDARAVQLIDQALVEIPVLNQRLSHYTASLPREQQQQLAQRLRRQPWQVELNTLLRSPQYKGFGARAAKNPALKTAADRLQNAGFLGATKSGAASTAAAPAAPAPAATAKPQPAATTVAAPVKAQPAASAAPATLASAGPAPKAAPAESAAKPVAPKPAAAAGTRHKVLKGETLFSISRQYGVTPAQLLEWNSKTSEKVKVGEELEIKTTR